MNVLLLVMEPVLYPMQWLRATMSCQGVFTLILDGGDSTMIPPRGMIACEFEIIANPFGQQ